MRTSNITVERLEDALLNINTILYTYDYKVWEYSIVELINKAIKGLRSIRDIHPPTMCIKIEKCAKELKVMAKDIEGILNSGKVDGISEDVEIFNNRLKNQADSIEAILSEVSVTMSNGARTAKR